MVCICSCSVVGSCSYSCSCLSIYLSTCKLEKEAILSFWTWQHQKRSNCATPPQLLTLITSRTKQYCETSSSFEIGKIKNEAILRDFSFKHGKLSAELTASYHCVLRCLHSICLKYCACHEKVRPGHTKCCICHAKSSQQTWRSDAPKCNPFQGISALTFNISGEHVSCNAPATGLASLQILFKCPTPANVFGTATKPSRFAHFQGAESLAHATQNHILTSKSGPRPSVFHVFHFQMCFAPQRRALFRHLNFQKGSGHGVLCTFWLRNLLRATAASTFDISTSKSDPRPRNVLRTTTACTFSTFSTSKSASNLVCFAHFDFKMCFAPQRRAIFHLSSPQTAPHPPL